MPGYEAGIGAPDLTIGYGDVADPALDAYQGTPDLVGGEIPPDFIFYCLHGKRILVNERTTADAGSIQTYTSGIAMAALLRQRGRLVLHASCVAKNGAAIGFLGASGAGKTSIAAYCHQRGYALFNDDVLALDVREAERAAWALPGGSTLRLRPDAGAALLEQFEDLPFVMEGSAKRIAVVRPAHALAPTRLRAFFMIDTHFGEANALVPADHATALQYLFHHTHARNLLQHPVHRVQHFRLCSAVAATVPGYYLARKHGIDQLPEMFGLIEAALEQAGA